MGRHLVNVCDGFWLSVTDASVQLIGSDAAALLEEAEEIEDLKVPSTPPLTPFRHPSPLPRFRLLPVQA